MNAISTNHLKFVIKNAKRKFVKSKNSLAKIGFTDWAE